MDLLALQSQIREFAEERDWDQFHTIRNLVLALLGEAGELAAEVQWLENLDAEKLKADPKLFQSVSNELADILIYLCRLADVAGVDLERATQNKITQNAKRYTIQESKGKAVKR